MAADKVAGSRIAHKVTACATGCEPVAATVTTWTMGHMRPDGIVQRNAAKVTLARGAAGGLVAVGFGSEDLALEAVATQLEALAAKVRALKGGRY